MNSPLFRLLLVLILSLVLVGGCLAETRVEPDTGPVTYQGPEVVRATVTRHTDGDTAWFRFENGIEEKVRFTGIDTPEVFGQAEEYGAEASAYTAEAIPIGATVWLETDARSRDRYDRLLAYVWLQQPTDGSAAEAREHMLNARLLRDGYALLLTLPPNVKYIECFTDAATEARERQRGLWGLDER